MIQVNHLSFSYTKQPFISDMTFSVSPGEIFGFLGPSGAGKSTLQKVLTGMLASYQGSAMVNGVECRERTKDFYEDIGVDFEFSALYEKLTARENLRFFASLYEKKPCPIDELLETVGLERDGDKRVSQYSKGMKAMMKDMILAQKAKGKTILLTTHNMQDAAELCDRVAFIVGGRICALDSPHNLIMSQGAATVTYTWLENGEHSAARPLHRLSADGQLKRLISENRLQSIHSSEPTLNDIFMDITGRTLI